MKEIIDGIPERETFSFYLFFWESNLCSLGLILVLSELYFFPSQNKVNFSRDPPLPVTYSPTSRDLWNNAMAVQQGLWTVLLGAYSVWLLSTNKLTLLSSLQTMIYSGRSTACSCMKDLWSTTWNCPLPLRWLSSFDFQNSIHCDTDWVVILALNLVFLKVSEVEVAAVGCCTLVAIVVAGGGFGSPQR